MEENNTQAEAASGLPQQQAPSLSLQDLILMFQIIQVVSTRGGFKADEMSNVGSLYDRLRAFLESAGVIKPAGAPTESGEQS